MHLKSVLLRGVALGRRGFIRGELLYKIVFIKEITVARSEELFEQMEDLDAKTAAVQTKSKAQKRRVYHCD